MFCKEYTIFVQIVLCFGAKELRSDVNHEGPKIQLGSHSIVVSLFQHHLSGAYFLSTRPNLARTSTTKCFWVKRVPGYNELELNLCQGHNTPVKFVYT